MATRLNNSWNCFKSCAILGDGGTIASLGDNNELRCGEVSCSTLSSSVSSCISDSSGPGNSEIGLDLTWQVLWELNWAL